MQIFKSFISLIKRHRLISFLVILSLSCTLFIVVQTRPGSNSPTVPSPSSTKIQSPDQVINSAKYSQVVWKVPSDFKLPLTVDKYTASLQPVNILSLAEKISLSLNIPKHSSLDQYWQSSDSSRLVFLDIPKQDIYFQVDSYTDTRAWEGPNRPQINDSIATASRFIKSLSLPYDLRLINSQTKYIEEIHGRTIYANPNQANLILLSFAQTIGDYPIYLDASINTQAQIFSAQKSQVVKLILSSRSVSLPKVVATVQPLSLTEIRNRINQGQATILNFNFSDPLKVDLAQPDLDQITINQANLEYRFNSATGELNPYLRLSGTYGENELVELIIPATP